jgi:hypothetical protein
VGLDATRTRRVLASSTLRELHPTIGNDVLPLYREDHTGGVPVEEFFIRSVFVHHRLRRKAEAFFEIRIAIFRMPWGILGDAEPGSGDFAATSCSSRLAAFTGPYAIWRDFLPSG